MCTSTNVANDATVVTEDGHQARFHAGAKANHGFIYFGKGRIYGTVTPGSRVYNAATGEWTSTPPSFVATGKWAWLVQPAPSADQLVDA